MAHLTILCIILLLPIICEGTCSFRDLSITQNLTGVKVRGKPEWTVKITNNCACVQLNVILNCQGFRTVEKIDPSVLRISPARCLVNNGQSVYGDAVQFNYASDKQFEFTPLSSQIACS
ncbi:hypothetical protein LR48_Vigan07g244600 [Vigna angularis]|uniref:Beta-1,3-N-Acetylglucosaminyltransferase family protein n=2 Tax=Phaseolus angularis TaxID=3914 RepID=A0A0L9V1J9_PHAAN|nr:uncharacterized protein LOC108337865 [Vigna angularis]KOM48742.1 hypothetical protein LR48_Vigan07g244600 [Vigna angularis]BAT82391.1 hypothetical protein VIGAN_03240400 [Vigna angularis var. angularis]